MVGVGELASAVVVAADEEPHSFLLVVCSYLVDRSCTLAFGMAAAAEVEFEAEAEAGLVVVVVVLVESCSCQYSCC